MAELRSILQESWRQPFVKHSFFQGPSKTKHELSRIQAKLSGVEIKVPDAIDLRSSYRELKAIFQNRNSLDSASKKALRHAPWVIFESWDKDALLAEDIPFMQAYLVALARKPQSRLISGLVTAILYYYPSHLKYFYKLCEFIEEKLMCSCNGPRIRKLQERVAKHALLKAEGPQNCWSFFKQQNGSLEERLVPTVFSGLLLHSRFLAATLGVALKQAELSLGEEGFREDFLTSLFALALFRNQGQTRLVFNTPSDRLIFVNSLLLPFSVYRNLEKLRELQPKIAKVVFSLFGDPRFERERWLGVDERAVRVAMDWLIQDTLDVFFALIKHIAKGNEEAARHWRFRQTFWAAYLRRGVIQDAWVILRPRFRKKALAILEREEEELLFGDLLSGQGVLGNHSALIMRVGGLVITEWSHNGKVRIWGYDRIAAGLAPELYKKEYTRSELIDYAEIESAHYNSENGTWQARLAGYIRSVTGIKVRKKEYMPT